MLITERKEAGDEGGKKRDRTEEKRNDLNAGSETELSSFVFTRLI